MPAKVFETKDELHKVLATKKQAVQNFLSNRCFDTIEEFVHDSVAGSTFRAFQFKRYGISNHRPSELFRTWTAAQFRENLDTFRNCDNRYEMQRHVVCSAHALDKYWSTQTEHKCPIKFGRAAKLLSLAAKYALRWNQITQAEVERLKRILPIPLDSYSLQGIMKICPDLGINARSTMGFVYSEAQYIDIQNRIYDICAPEFDPIDYEIVVWDSAHHRVIHHPLS